MSTKTIVIILLIIVAIYFLFVHKYKVANQWGVVNPNIRASAAEIFNSQHPLFTFGAPPSYLKFAGF